MADSRLTTSNLDPTPPPPIDNAIVVYTKGRGPSAKRAELANTLPPRNTALPFVIDTGPPPTKQIKLDTQDDYIPLSSSSEVGAGDRDTPNTIYSDVGDGGAVEGEEYLELCPEQQRVVDLAVAGRNIFYTGSAGCGKTRVLQAIKARLTALGKTVQVMAPTGKAALAIGGMTTYSFAGMILSESGTTMKKLREDIGLRKANRKRFEGTDVIIIDEISMVENLHLEQLSVVMQAGRQDFTRPFGGVQVILTGDFCQLPPVKPFEHCIQCGKEFRKRTERGERVYYCISQGCGGLSYRESDKWAFRSRVWAQCNFEHINLTTIHRQHDPKFISILQKCRMGIPFSPEDIHELLNHHSDTRNAVKLFSTRSEVEKTNKEELEALPGETHQYTAVDHFSVDNPTADRSKLWNKYGQFDNNGTLKYFNKNDHRLAAQFKLKLKTQVLLVVNLNIRGGLCNGSQGVVVDFEPYDESKLPRESPDNSTGPGLLVGKHAGLRESEIKRFARKQKEDYQKQGRTHPGWPRVHFWGLPTTDGKSGKMTRTIYPECIVTEVGDAGIGRGIVARTQLPLLAAWALTMHKAQGMTLGRVIVDLSKAFEKGQVYVALSRATDLKGLKVEGGEESLTKMGEGNKEVREWLEGPLFKRNSTAGDERGRL